MLDLIEQKLSGVHSGAAERRAAAMQVGGVFAALRERLAAEDQQKWLQFLLVLSDAFENGDWWMQLAKMPPDEFDRELSRIRATLPTLRVVAGSA